MMIENMVMESSHGLMVENMLESGEMENSMVLVYDFFSRALGK